MNLLRTFLRARWANAIFRHILNASGNLDHWFVATIIALLVSLGTASLIHGIEQHDSRLDAIEAKVNSLDCKP